ncbi:hypothetical protein [Streptomyces sp. NPDC089919]|uniref:hypothetical protein n=1 Tax=Streptomyces sp. NPDC089919 TaxID=3155188 RepID=UPI00343008E8
MRTSPRPRRRRVLTAAAVATLALATACGGGSAPEAVVQPLRVLAQTGTGQASQLTYDLGDRAYAPPGLSGQLTELRAEVTAPRRLTGAKHPLVMVLHGWGDVCAAGDRPDRPASWPCTKGSRPVDNYLGYGYLAQALAARGYIVVSVSADGIQAQEKDRGNVARAALLDKHLEMWRDLAQGKGPLKALKQFTGHVDLTRVGTVGHSRGGGGVLTQALDGHKGVPGVTLRGTLALAPAMNGIDTAKEHLTRVPLAVLAGTCDAMWEDSKVALTLAAGNPHAEHQDVTGGNHNAFNTVWTPGTGPAFATDDVAVEHRDRPGGRCESTNGTGTPKRLTPAEQQALAVRYATRFFDRYLR